MMQECICLDFNDDKWNAYSHGSKYHRRRFISFNRVNILTNMDNNLISEIKDLLVKQHESISGVNSTMWKQMIDTQKGMETKIDALIVQTTKTNGSVVTLKAEMSEMKDWKEGQELKEAKIQGGVSVFWKIITTVGGIIVAVWVSLISFNGKIL